MREPRVGEIWYDPLHGEESEIIAIDPPRVKILKISRIRTFPTKIGSELQYRSDAEFYTQLPEFLRYNEPEMVRLTLERYEM